LKAVWCILAVNLTWGLCCFAAPRVLAQELVKPDNVCHTGVAVRVRAIRTHGLKEKKLTPAEQLKAPRSRRLYIDEALADLEPKLQALPYRSYKVMTIREIVLPVDKQQSLKLIGGQTLNLRLLYADKARVGMWLNWLDKKGGVLLDTRLHFNRDEPMLTGTESSKKCGTLLALEVVGK